MRYEPHHNAKFVRNILEKFRTTDASQLSITDKVIQKVGYRHYCLRRCHESKQDERKTSVRQEMTELARLLLQFRSTSTKLDMDCSNLETEAIFTRIRVALLWEAFNTLAEGGKYGLTL